MEMLKTSHNAKRLNTEIPAVVQQGSVKSSPFSKTRILLVACLVITIIAVVIVAVLAALYVKEKDDEKETASMIGQSPTPSTTPSNQDLIMLDISSSHADIFVSSNRTMMSRTFFNGSISGPGKRPLMNYQGVLADRSVLKEDKLDIRFEVEYKIIGNEILLSAIFDIAICSLCNIDKSWVGGAHCRSMTIRADNKANSSELFFTDNGKHSSNKYFFGSLNVGTTTTVSYNVHVSGRNNSISYSDLSGKHLHTFSSVSFSEPLYILFGLYNPQLFQSVLQLV